ncbi:MAG: hypothetical protein HYW26_04340 [Candidatus Aenigmarchaeota archaeon]|nr:hypothetical protein [Candidatus Aenigmarchaeota archaeon]
MTQSFTELENTMAVSEILQNQPIDFLEQFGEELRKNGEYSIVGLGLPYASRLIDGSIEYLCPVVTKGKTLGEYSIKPSDPSDPLSELLGKREGIYYIGKHPIAARNDVEEVFLSYHRDLDDSSNSRRGDKWHEIIFPNIIDDKAHVQTKTTS